MTRRGDLIVSWRVLRPGDVVRAWDRSFEARVASIDVPTKTIVYVRNDGERMVQRVSGGYTKVILRQSA